MYVPSSRQKVKRRWKPLLQKPKKAPQGLAPWLEASLWAWGAFFFLLCLGFFGQNFYTELERQLQMGRRSYRQEYILPQWDQSVAEPETQLASLQMDLQLDAPQPSGSSLDRHIVQEGDKIDLIAWNYGIQAESIISFNGLQSPRDLYPGRPLLIPPFDGRMVNIPRRWALEEWAHEQGIQVNQIMDSSVERRYFAALDVEHRGYWNRSLRMPLSAELIQNYGDITDPLTDVVSFHGGIDLAAPLGTEVRAVERGRVIKRGIHSFFGKYMIVSHPNGFQSFYGHLESFGISQGEEVEKGQTLAILGQSGQAHGPQLHFALFIDDKMVDPMEYLF